MKRAFIVDSTANIRPELLDEPGIYELPIGIHFHNGDELTEMRQSEVVKAFYRRLVDEDPLPKTTQPPLQAYYRVFDDCLEAGVDEVFVLLLAANISGSYQSANVVAEEYADRLTIHVIETGTTAAWIGYLLDICRALDQKGASSEAIEQALTDLLPETYFTLFVKDLTNLVKGGRAGATQAMFGKIFNITPVIHMEADGCFYPKDRVRSKKRLYKRLLQDVADHVATYAHGLAKLVVLHADNEAEALDLYHRLEDIYPGVPIELGDITPAIGVHIGRGTVALSSMPKVNLEAYLHGTD